MCINYNFTSITKKAVDTSLVEEVDTSLVKEVDTSLVKASLAATLGFNTLLENDINCANLYISNFFLLWNTQSFKFLNLSTLKLLLSQVSTANKRNLRPSITTKLETTPLLLTLKWL